MNIRRVIRGAVLAAMLASVVQVGRGQAPAPPPVPTFSRVVVLDLATKHTTTLFRGEGVWEAPNWSHDGKYLLVNSGGRLYRLPLDRPTPEPLPLDVNLRLNNDHDFSPDGTRLAFSAASPESAQSQVYLAKADGTEVTRVVSAPLSYFHGWSPDGRWLSFVGNRDGKQFDIYRLPAAGGPEERLTSNTGHDDGSDYSRDGQWIYFNSDRSGTGDIWRMPATGAGAGDALAQRVTSDAWEDWFPHPSPDGRHLVFISFPAGTPGHNLRHLAVQIRKVPLPGDAPATALPEMLVTFTGGQGSMNVNSWSPDSKKLAFVSYEFAEAGK